MPAPPVCLACRRPLPLEQGTEAELSLSLEGPDVLAVSRQLAAEGPDDDSVQVVLGELLGDLCRSCGRPA